MKTTRIVKGNINYYLIIKGIRDKHYCNVWEERNIFLSLIGPSSAASVLCTNYIPLAIRIFQSADVKQLRYLMCWCISKESKMNASFSFLQGRGVNIRLRNRVHLFRVVTSTSPGLSYALALGIYCPCHSKHCSCLPALTPHPAPPTLLHPRNGRRYTTDSASTAQQSFVCSR